MTACTIHIRYRDSLFTKASNTDARKALFIAPRGKRMNATKVKRLVKEYLSKAAHVSQKSPHVLRHTFATHMLDRSEEHTSELQSRGHLVCRLLLEKKKTQKLQTLACSN